MKKLKIISIIIASVFVLNLSLYAKDGYYLLKAGIHFDSNVSGGKYSLNELAKIITKEKLDVAIITDHDNMDVSYGIKPFQELLKITISRNSVRKYGFENYFSYINYLDRIYNNTIFIPGIEAVPFYYWTGNPLDKNLILNGWHTHLLIFGISSVEYYKKLPSLYNNNFYDNYNGNTLKYISNNFNYFLKLFFYFTIALLLLFYVIKKIYLKRKVHGVRSPALSTVFFIIVCILIITEYPFKPKKYTQYSNDPGTGPYQYLIDYVNKYGGLVFWAHPEVTHEETLPLNIPFMQNQIKISTEAYPDLVYQTKNHSGFAIFWEGMKTLGRPGGLWDMALKEYCLGLRKKPFWVIGELDFEESNNLDLLHETNTFIFAKEFSQEGVIEAMRKGRMYATRSYFGDLIEINDFSIHDPYTNTSAFIGETLILTYPEARIHIKINLKKNISKPINIFLFRGTQLIKEMIFDKPVDVWIEDINLPSEKKFYYKIYIGNKDWISVATNPIFVIKQ